MDMPQVRIPNRLRWYRRMSGYSQGDVAAILGLVNKARISLWENGIAYPGIENLLKLSIVYKTLPSELYSDLYKKLLGDVFEGKRRLFSNSPTPSSGK